jgi:DNA polymerase/3'-5' exonuclease PolX
MNKKNFKFEIIEHLTNIKNYLIQMKEYYKVQAYSKVLTQLYGLKQPIYNYEDFIKNIKAGERINSKIKELIETGIINYEKENIIKDDIYYFKEQLNDIYGIGKVKTDELIANGITSIEQLKRNQHLLNNKQKIGLLYYDDIKKRIPLEEFKIHKKLIEKDLKKYDITYDFVGSYRRGSETMGDIDLIIMEDRRFNLISYINDIRNSGYILETLGLGKHKFMGIVRIGNNPARRLDILIAPKKEYYYSLLYFTGSADFNVGFRNYVKSNFNLSLSEHGIKGLKEEPIIKSEKDIFDYFKIPYLKPKDRKIFIIPIK